MTKRTTLLAALSLQVGGGLATTTPPLLPLELKVKEKQELLQPATELKEKAKASNSENASGSRKQAARPMEEPNGIMVRGSAMVKNRRAVGKHGLKLEKQNQSDRPSAATIRRLANLM